MIENISRAKNPPIYVNSKFSFVHRAAAGESLIGDWIVQVASESLFCIINKFELNSEFEKTTMMSELENIQDVVFVVKNLSWLFEYIGSTWVLEKLDYNLHSVLVSWYHLLMCSGIWKYIKLVKKKTFNRIFRKSNNLLDIHYINVNNPLFNAIKS